MLLPALRGRAAWTKAAVAGVLATATFAAVAIASDHQDTPLVEFSPRFDVNDVYAFPASDPSRIALVLSTSSPLTPMGTKNAAFGDEKNALYQLKVDNTGDGREDLVFQFVFSGSPSNQHVRMYGPVAPNEVGTLNTIVSGTPTLEGDVDTMLGSASGVQLFAGPRDDPFFIDLTQFFSILPDRKPEAGKLAQIKQGPLTFRAAGEATDFLRGFNDLAIVVELPITQLTANGAKPQFGIWGTTSRVRDNNGH